MAKAVQIVACLIFLGLLLPNIPTWAADDDLTSSAYLVFDPETGEFIIVHDPDRTKQNHAALAPSGVAGVEAAKPAPTLAVGSSLTIALLAIAVWLQLRKSNTS